MTVTRNTPVTVEETYARWAEAYDRFFSCDPKCIDILEALAVGGTALEFGVGTGRIALPLASKGVQVTGTDISEAMLKQLRRKEGADRLSILAGNFLEVPEEGRWDLIYVVCSTFTHLLTQSEQILCFKTVERRLAERGSFVVEIAAPSESIFSHRWTTEYEFADSQAVFKKLVLFDLFEQIADVRLIETREEGTTIYPIRQRFVWPTELDLLAEIAGLRLHQRWSNWNKEPFTANSRTHVSVYKRK